MVVKTNWGLVDWAKKWLGMPYWYGCVCYKCTQDLLTRKAKQYPKHYTQARMSRYKSDIAASKWASDCIGLAKGYMWWDPEKMAVKYAANGCPDMSANGMLEKATVKGDIKTLPEIPGLMLWMNGHAGVYIGGGWAIEERGFAYGCVKTKVSDRPWKKWYRLPGLTYMDADDGSGREDMPFDKKEEVVKDDRPVIEITGDAVNVRLGNGTNYYSVGTVGRGDKMSYVASSDNGWHAGVFKQQVVWVSGRYSKIRNKKG